jgi:7-carboxy-7-deazaguanine synthase
MLEVTEIFHSLQGEGPFAGRPAVFLRLSRCLPPLCPWCDSAFAWEPGDMVSEDNLVTQILEYNCSFVVITGGEPFLQWSKGLQELAQKLTKQGCTLQYETSGKTAIPDDSGGFVVCSPKYLDNLWHFKELNRGVVDSWKFVVDEDFEVVDEFIHQQQIDPSTVWIMGLGATRKAQLENVEQLWNFCVARGYNYSPRLHTLAFDNKKGV